jgi:hypothetical protein
MCSAGCGDCEVAAVMPPAVLVTVAGVGSCSCDCKVAVVITVLLLQNCCDQTCNGRCCVMAVVILEMGAVY